VGEDRAQAVRCARACEQLRKSEATAQERSDAQKTKRLAAEEDGFNGCEGEYTLFALHDRYFKDGLLGGTMCGFGVEEDPRQEAWELDASGCELGEIEGWREEYANLEVLDLSDNDLVELPGWLGEGRMGKLRELRARGNKLDAFVDGMLGGGNATLEMVDLRDNVIAELPYVRVKRAQRTCGADGSKRESRAGRPKRPSAAEAGNISGWRGRERSEQEEEEERVAAAEAGRISGCRGETPRTPPAAGEVARVAHVPHPS
jgi:hypothetical protein